MRLPRMLRALLPLALLLAAAGGCASAHGAHFAYTGDDGPAFWGDLDPEWTACDAGVAQSPVDLAGAVADPLLAPLDLDLRPTPLRLSNNGHTIEQACPGGGTLTIGGATFDLLQCHFHTLSEHTIAGRHSPLELHAVFRDAASGRLAVVGVMFEVGTKESPYLASLLSAGLPGRAGETVDRDLPVDLREALTSTASYWRYSGSLTTPPCSPIVTWTVLKAPASMTAEQDEAFRRVLGNNFRPVQPLAGRTVSETR